MAWPTDTDYSEALQNPSSAFTDQLLRSGHVQLDAYRIPWARSGNMATVYRVDTSSGAQAVRCFRIYNSETGKRYAAIDDYLRRISLPYTVTFDFLANGLRVGSKTYPTLRMEWVEGITLGKYIENNLNIPSRLRGLAAEWALMLSRLQEVGIAHGDLQHGNVIVKDGGLKLVDYDGLYVPAFHGKVSLEIGHRNYQHPARKPMHFGPFLDNFSGWLIYLSIIALVTQPDLWPLLGAGDECLLFRKEDLDNPHSSEAFRALDSNADKNVRRLTKLIRAYLKMRPDQVPPLKVLPGKTSPELPSAGFIPELRVWFSGRYQPALGAVLRRGTPRGKGGPSHYPLTSLGVAIRQWAEALWLPVQGVWKGRSNSTTRTWSPQRQSRAASQIVASKPYAALAALAVIALLLWLLPVKDISRNIEALLARRLPPVSEQPPASTSSSLSVCSEIEAPCACRIKSSFAPSDTVLLLLKAVPARRGQISIKVPGLPQQTIPASSRITDAKTSNCQVFRYRVPKRAEVGMATVHFSLGPQPGNMVINTNFDIAIPQSTTPPIASAIVAKGKELSSTADEPSTTATPPITIPPAGIADSQTLASEHTTELPRVEQHSQSSIALDTISPAPIITQPVEPPNTTTTTHIDSPNNRSVVEVRDTIQKWASAKASNDLQRHFSYYTETIELNGRRDVNTASMRTALQAYSAQGHRLTGFQVDVTDVRLASADEADARMNTISQADGKAVRGFCLLHLHRFSVGWRITSEQDGR